MTDKTFSKTQVINLIKQLTGQANLLTTPILFVRALGDMNSAILLGQILYWQDKTTREDGFFWKSRREWNDEIGLSIEAMRRATKILKRASCGLETKVLRAEGSPTLHYHLDEDKFVPWITGMAEKFQQMEMFSTTDGTVVENKTVTENTPETTTTKEERYKKEETTPLKEAETVFALWNEQGIVKHRRLTTIMLRAFNKARENFDLDEILQAIRNYSEILHHDEYYYDYTWGLAEFLASGLKKFALPIEVCKVNFHKNGHDGTGNGRGKLTIIDENAEGLLQHYREATGAELDDNQTEKYRKTCAEILKKAGRQEAEDCIDWCLADTFWMDNYRGILTHIAKDGIGDFRRHEKKKQKAPGHAGDGSGSKPAHSGVSSLNPHH